MSHTSLLSLDESNFEELVIKSERPVLVDFWATWCRPCTVVGPIVERLADRFDGRAGVGKVDVDTSGELAARFGVRSIPTLAVFKNGQIVEQLVGVTPEEELAALLERHAA
jgi:thioredoxin 1